MKSCLIIDDSRVVRKVARRIIEDLGFTCAEAEDGMRGFESCTTQMPDLIMLDWNMPVMSGFEFLEKMRALTPTGGPKIILCTTENNQAHIERALNAGVDEYIIKPFDSGIIHDKLQKIGVI